VKRVLLGGLGIAVLAGGALLIPMGGGVASEMASRHLPTSSAGSASTTPFAELSSDAPKKPLSLVFLHHSVGGRLLADPGEKKASGNEIWQSHPNGGGLRTLLQKAGYQVHEASYGSALGDTTDRGDFLAKFRDHLDQLLALSLNDQKLPEGQRNQIVLWKECFPNNFIDGEKGLEQAKQEMRALLPVFAQHPDVLFVHLTTPPLAAQVEKEPAWKYLARAVLGKAQPGARLEKSGPLARQLNDWVVNEWLKDYQQKNVAVFDLYNLLTDGKSNFLAFPTGDGSDSHPSRAGNERATRELVPFLNRAVRRAGLSE
jgi:hypothetical protein